MDSFRGCRPMGLHFFVVFQLAVGRAPADTADGGSCQDGLAVPTPMPGLSAGPDRWLNPAEEVWSASHIGPSGASGAPMIEGGSYGRH